MRPPARHPASFPCSPVVAINGAAAPRAEEFSCDLDFTAGLGAALFEARGLPDLKLIAKADKRDCGVEAGVRAKPFRKDDAAVAVDRENLDVAVERERELIALVRIVRQTCEKPIDFLCKSFAACIECWSIERGVAVDASRIAVAFEYGAKW